MIKSFTVTNYLGDSIVMEMGRPEQSGFLIKSVSGLGPAKADINETEISTNDGSLFNSARLNKRNIVFELVFIDSIFGGSIEDIRQKSYQCFPIKKELTLVIETDNRILKTTGYVESNIPTIFGAKGSREGTQISIICPDPYLYSLDINESTTVFFGVESSFEFPFSNESLSECLIEFGAIQNKTENLITYDGDAEIGITIQIHAIGEATNVTIYNTGTRETMTVDTTKLASLTGYGIISGDDITICTTKGEKSISLLRSGVTTNILNCLDKNSKWFSLTKGDNIFAFSALTGTRNLQFRIKNKVIFEGI